MKLEFLKGITNEGINSVLSGSALDALKEFYAERDAHQQKFEDLKQRAEEQADGAPLTMEAFAEDWNESQFWVGSIALTRLWEIIRGL